MALPTLSEASLQELLEEAKERCFQARLDWMWSQLALLCKKALEYDRKLTLQALEKELSRDTIGGKGGVYES